MNIIILEGIATSGKTSVVKELIKGLNKQKAGFSVIDEQKTLMALLDNINKRKSIEFLKQIVVRAISKKKDFIIFDRLFLTHVFRTKSAIADYSEIENLIKNNAILIFLKIDETKIPERINYARKHRNKEWNDYVDKKGSEDQINNYYIGQQRLLLELMENSTLNCKAYNTSNMDFDYIAKDILKHFKK